MFCQKTSFVVFVFQGCALLIGQKPNIERAENKSGENKLSVGFISWQRPLKDQSIMVTLKRKHEIDSWMKNFLSTKIQHSYSENIWVRRPKLLWQKTGCKTINTLSVEYVGMQKSCLDIGLSDIRADSGCWGSIKSVEPCHWKSKQSERANCIMSRDETTWILISFQQIEKFSSIFLKHAVPENQINFMFVKKNSAIKTICDEWKN